MKAQDKPRFDIGTLCELAGDKVFARGQAYHEAGQVNILTHEPERVLAQVTGTEDYRTVLKGCGAKIEGECSCPAFEDWGFCKHMVLQPTRLAKTAQRTVRARSRASGIISRPGVLTPWSR